MKTAILALPAGYGKSSIAQALAQWLGCTSVVAEWRPAMPVEPGALHLTNCDFDDLLEVAA